MVPWLQLFLKDPFGFWAIWSKLDRFHGGFPFLVTTFPTSVTIYMMNRKDKTQTSRWLRFAYQILAITHKPSFLDDLIIPSYPIPADRRKLPTLWWLGKTELRRGRGVGLFVSILRGFAAAMDSPGGHLQLVVHWATANKINVMATAPVNWHRYRYGRWPS